MEIVSLLLEAGANPNVMDKVCQYSLCCVYGVPAESNMIGELDRHVYCTKGLLPLCLSFISVPHG